MLNDFISVIQWWSILFFLGIIFFPLTKLLFKNSSDSFYIFSKVIGIGIISYTLLVFGFLYILPFNIFSILFVLILYASINGLMYKRNFYKKSLRISKVIIFEELLFFSALTFWTYIKGHEPSIQSLEKFMDFGFINSALRSDFFPPRDMWFTPFPINYYYFGHLTTAILTKLSFLKPSVAYNLMLATLFAFTLTGAFSIVFNFLHKFGPRKSILGGLLAGLLLSLGGNIHTIYSFFSPYNGEQPVPPWDLTFLPNMFPNAYWYPNATRFIPFTIHEFPLYSFVVSDLHGHVLDIPFVLLIISLLYTVLQTGKISKLHSVIIGFFLSILYMTNIWDGIIYLGLLFLIIGVLKSTILTFAQKSITSILNTKKFLYELMYSFGLVTVLYIFFSVPFNLNFKPFASGIGFICAPKFLTNIGKIGPLLFETDHCQKSDLYQLAILYGFFIFFILSFLVFKIMSIKKLFFFSQKLKKYSLQMPTDKTPIFIFLLISLSLLLIVTPEFLYAKDIYPDHYRANTMFKLVYQAFIMLSLVSAYIIIFFSTIKNRFVKIFFFFTTFILLFLVFLYPYFAIRSYFGDLREYKGIDGMQYMKINNPGDLETIDYLNKNVFGQPVILEAQGDSYTNFARISANTGLPTVLGWTVHEWLWRGSDEVPKPRITEVETMYQGSLEQAVPLLKKYNVQYVIIGNEEKNKYIIAEGIYQTLGKVIFQSTDKSTKIYQLSL